MQITHRTMPTETGDITWWLDDAVQIPFYDPSVEGPQGILVNAYIGGSKISLLDSGEKSFSPLKSGRLSVSRSNQSAFFHIDGEPMISIALPVVFVELRSRNPS